MLSIIIPAFNEADTLPVVLARVLELPMDKEVVVVDDGSTDGTPEAVERGFRGRPGLRVIRLKRNQGKGAAVRAGLAAASGTAAIVQDADLELDPADIPAVAAPVLEGRAAACYGSRFLAGRGRAGLAGWLANRLLTGLTNVLFAGRLTDMETCYKCVRLDVLRGLDLESRRFELEPELTAKLLLAGHGILEVPVRYEPRGRAQGKKIGWRDGLHAVATLLRCRRRTP